MECSVDKGTIRNATKLALRGVSSLPEISWQYSKKCALRTSPAFKTWRVNSHVGRAIIGEDRLLVVTLLLGTREGRREVQLKMAGLQELSQSDKRLVEGKISCILEPTGIRSILTLDSYVILTLISLQSLHPSLSPSS